MPELLVRVLGSVRRFIGDGAYDGAPTAATIRRTFGPDVELIIPPPKNAVPGECATRNVYIELIANQGRMAWRKASGYGERSRGEAQIERYTQVIGPQLLGCQMETQTIETEIASDILNRMTRLGRAVDERIQ